MLMFRPPALDLRSVSAYEDVRSEVETSSLKVSFSIA